MNRRSFATLPATPPQQVFLESLFNDCGFKTAFERNAFLELRVGREIHFLDELTVDEASRVITELKDQRERKRIVPRREEDE